MIRNMIGSDLPAVVWISHAASPTWYLAIEIAANGLRHSGQGNCGKISYEDLAKQGYFWSEDRMTMYSFKVNATTLDGRAILSSSQLHPVGNWLSGMDLDTHTLFCCGDLRCATKDEALDIYRSYEKERQQGAYMG